MPNERSTKEQIKHFAAEDKWKGGYFEGDPLDPMSPSTYSVFGYMSIIHATYLACIKPYVNANTRVLEIGPGRGAWTRTFLHAREVVCLDALSAEHNGFWDYVGGAPNVQYHQVDDFECRVLPENHFDYLFSFGCFCHISPAGSREYLRNLYGKLTSGAHGFIMIGDHKKRQAMIRNSGQLSSFRMLNKRRFWPARFLYRLIYSLHPGDDLKPVRERSEEEQFKRVWFHNLGMDRACNMLDEAGFRVIDRDVGTVYRDVILHFVKP